MGVNEKHKNSVFSLLFSDKDVLRELYSAIGGIELPPDTSIKINTLTNALFMGQINDVSFTVGDRMIVLIEHQSNRSDKVLRGARHLEGVFGDQQHGGNKHAFCGMEPRGIGAQKNEASAT